jgi:hypothetical protein
MQGDRFTYGHEASHPAKFAKFISNLRSDRKPFRVRREGVSTRVGPKDHASIFDGESLIWGTSVKSRYAVLQQGLAMTWQICRDWPRSRMTRTPCPRPTPRPQHFTKERCQISGFIKASPAGDLHMAAYPDFFSLRSSETAGNHYRILHRRWAIVW